jgi:hypothetical protein
MTTVEFKGADAWRGPGAPPVAIPKQVSDALDKTYRENKVAEMPAEEGAEDTSELLRLMAIYARRKGKACRVQFFDGPDGESMLRFRMSDKRPYRSHTVGRERR